MALLAANPAAVRGGGLRLFGLVVGSFLNVVIHRLPLMLERQWRAQAAERRGPAGAGRGRAATTSSCRARAARPAMRRSARIHNIPVLSWLVAARALRRLPRADLDALSAGRARDRRSPSPPSPGISASGCTPRSRLVFTAYLIALTGIDIDHQLLPDILTLPLLWIGLIASLWHVRGQCRAAGGAARAVIGAAAGYLLLWLVFQLFKLMTGKEGMGYGDFKLFAAIGAWLGWQMLPLVLLLSAVGRRGRSASR